MKRSVKDLVALKGKVVLLRVDFNVPIDDNGTILDATRIVNELPTIKYLIGKQARVVILSHLGRPKGYEARKSLWPIAMHLMKLLPCSVEFSTTLIGEEAKQRIAQMKEGSVLVLENTRFFEGEESCDIEFSRKLARLGDIYVNDAFGTAHRKNASTYGVARFLPNAMGLLMEREVNALSKSMEEPKRPFLAIVGGAKVSTKLKIINKLLNIADSIVIGGQMAYTFMYAKGIPVGECVVFDEYVKDAKAILAKADALGKKILLPIDHIVVSRSMKSKGPFQVKTMKGDVSGFDIGDSTLKLYKKEIYNAKQIFWNGPMGMFEDPKFEDGTKEIAKAVADSNAYSVVGGGDTVSAINRFANPEDIGFISTGGGATMEFLEDGTLPCIEVIQEKII